MKKLIACLVCLALVGCGDGSTRAFVNQETILRANDACGWDTIHIKTYPVMKTKWQVDYYETSANVKCKNGNVVSFTVKVAVGE